jgi:hypothetical protein
MQMSLRRAINDMCRSCIYDPHGNGTFLQQIEACTAVACPLHRVRPKSRKSAGINAKLPPKRSMPHRVEERFAERTGKS